MPVSIGTKISAAFYNAIQTIIAGILGPSGYNGTVTSSQVTAGSVDTAAQWNKLRTDINACRTIQAGTPFTSTELPVISLGALIKASDVNLYESTANTVFANYGGNLVLVNGVFTDTRTTTWTGTIDNEVVVSFADLATANGFFQNSGEVRLNLSQPTNNNAQDALWVSNLSNVGTISFTNTATTRSGTAGIPLAVGWSTMTSNYQMIFNGNRLHSGSSYTYVSVDDLYVYAKLNASGNGIVIKTVMTNGDNGTISASTLASYGVKKRVTDTTPSFAFLASNNFNAAVAGSGTTPTITAYTASGTTSSATTLNITSNVAGYAFAAVLPAASAAPTVATWPTLQNNINVVTNTPTTLTVPLASPSTAYKVYTFVEDAFGNASAVSSVSVTSASGTGVTAATIGQFFKTTPYTGSGPGSNLNVSNNIDLLNNPGFMIMRNRGSTANTFVALQQNVVNMPGNPAFKMTGPAGPIAPFCGFTSTGFTVNNSYGNSVFVSENAQNYITWSFRKSTNFVDIVTWTGDGAASRNIAHTLTQQPGLVLIKANTTGEIYASHRGTGANNGCAITLTTASAATSTTVASTAFSTGTFDVLHGTGGRDTNTLGTTYVAFVFAHDPSAGGVIQTGLASGNGLVSLGWTPQFILCKSVNDSGAWVVYDASRGIGPTSNPLPLNNTTAETTTASIQNGTNGFTIAGATTPMIWMAIRQ
jgi:uncharacterized protein (DUF1330 family)